MRKFLWAVLVLWGSSLITLAQDGFNLPTELYVLLNEGVLERYGLGASGIQKITPPQAFVLDFAVASDNQTLAYRTTDGLFLRDILQQAGDSIAILDNVAASYPSLRGKGDTLAWSPNNDALAFTTEKGASVWFDGNTVNVVDLGVADIFTLAWSPDGRHLLAGASEGVWWVFAVETRTLRLVSIVTSATNTIWADRDLLLFTPPTGGIVRMDLANANEQTALLSADERYHLPFILPDNSVIAFRGDPDNATLIQLNISGNQWVATQLGTSAVDIRDARWSPNGQLIITFRAGVIALVSPQTGDGFALPIASASAYGWGALYPQRLRPTLTQPVYFLNQALGDEARQVWQYDANTTQPITFAQAPISSFTLSPDQTRLAYASDGKLWYYRLGEGVESLFELAALSTEAEKSGYAFSPNNQRLYYRGVDGLYWANLTTGETYLWLADTDSQTWHAPQVAPNVDALLVTEVQTGRVFLVDANTAEITPLGNAERGVWLNGGRVILWEADALLLRDITRLDGEAQTLLPILSPLRVADAYGLETNRIRLLVSPAPRQPFYALDVFLDGTQPVNQGNIGYFSAPKLLHNGQLVLEEATLNAYDFGTSQAFILAVR